VFTLTAQIEEIPLLSNPTLKQHQAQEERATHQYIQQLTSDKLATSATTRSFFNCNDIMVEPFYVTGASIYVQAADSVIICVDTLHLITNGGFASINCTNCDAATLGMAELNGTCIDYEALASVMDAQTEILEIELCAIDGTCENLSFEVNVRRAGQIFDEPLTLVAAEETLELCVSATNYDLPGAINSSDLLSNDELLGATFRGFSKDSCFVYQANRFAELDSVSFEVCDDNCICDVFHFPIRIVGDTLNIPFMDDFSYAGPYPSKGIWLDRNVFINNNIAFQPPSVGVATFDGINEKGSPYGGGFGPSDFLTSNYFDLSAISSDVYLSFYYQAKGLGYSPEEEHSLVVEFNNDEGEWEEIDAFDGPNSSSTLPFTFAAYPIDDQKYMYNGFQFRFVNYSNRIGMQNVWHLDYVRISTNEIPDSTGTFDDVAFTQLPNPILERYSSMPWWQFKDFEDQELSDGLTVEVYNHFEMQNDLQNSSATTIELNTNTSFPVYVPFQGSQFNVPSQVYQIYNNDIPAPIYSDYLSQMENDFTGENALRFETTYAYEASEQNAAYEATATNDTVRYTTVFDNYFSYDDGTAETGVGLSIVGYEIALKFTANHPDTLRAIQMHFPHIFGAAAENQLFNIHVWIGELDDTPEYKEDFVKPFYASNVLDSLNGFTTYRLVGSDGLTPEGLALPAGDFYISYQQASTLSNQGVFVPIGLDKNNLDAQQYVYLWDLAEWTQIDPGGVPMIRAVVGGETPWNTAVEELKPTFEVIGLYPNPTTDYLNVSLQEFNHGDFEYFIINAAGKVLKFGALQTTINVTDLPVGMYYLNLYNQKTKVKSNHEFVIIR